MPDAFVQLKSCGWADVKKKMCLSVKTNQEMLAAHKGRATVEKTENLVRG